MEQWHYPARRVITDIRQTALKHKHITTCLPAVHALTGCDTVSYLFGIGKATALKVLLGGQHLIELGQQGADEGKLISEATTFVAASHGSKVEGHAGLETNARPKLVKFRPSEWFFRLDQPGGRVDILRGSIYHRAYCDHQPSTDFKWIKSSKRNPKCRPVILASFGIQYSVNVGLRRP